MPPLAVVRVVGPPGSGKTLLITALVEALRARGHLVATSAPREAATVITLSNGGRVTVERPLGLAALRALVPTLDPRAALLLAEALEEAGAPALVLAPPGAPPPHDPELLAAVSTEEVVSAFARFGPADIGGLAALIEQRVLGVAAPRKRGLLGRLRGRL